MLNMAGFQFVISCLHPTSRDGLIDFLKYHHDLASQMKTIGKMWVLDKHEKDFLCDVLTRSRLENKSGCQLTNEELENARTKLFCHIEQS